jgi:hypothetical protein
MRNQGGLWLDSQLSLMTVASFWSPLVRLLLLREAIGSVCYTAGRPAV